MLDVQTSPPADPARQADPTPEGGRLLRLWRRLPVWVRAPLAGIFVMAAGTVPWVVMISLNLKYRWAPLGPVPWAVPTMALWLWLYWRWFGGRGWPRSTAEARRDGLRARPLPGRVWAWALGAGLLGMLSITGLYLVIPYLVAIRRDYDDLSGYPVATVLLGIGMLALVAGLCEEAGFRGYMQGPLERRFGPTTAILIVGTLFGLAHTNHADWSVVMMPVYIGFSAVLGMLAWRTGSIVPGIVLHAGFDAIRFTVVWWRRPVLPSLIWNAGAPPAFWAAVAAFLLFGAAFVWAFRRLGAIATLLDSVSVHT